MATLFTPDNKEKHVHPKNGSRFTSQELLELVGENHECLALEQGQCLVITTTHNLALNTKATRLTFFLPRQHFVYGPALFASKKEIE